MQASPAATSPLQTHAQTTREAIRNVLRSCQPNSGPGRRLPLLAATRPAPAPSSGSTRCRPQTEALMSGQESRVSLGAAVPPPALPVPFVLVATRAAKRVLPPHPYPDAVL